MENLSYREFYDPYHKSTNNLNTIQQTIIQDIQNCKFSKLFSKQEYSNEKLCKYIQSIFLMLNEASMNFNKTIDNIDLFLNKCLEINFEIENFTQQDILYFTMYLIQGLLMKENWLGNSYLSPQAEKVLKKELQIDNKDKYDLDIYTDNKVIQLRKSLGLNENDIKFNFSNIKKKEFLKQYCTQIIRYVELNGIHYNRAFKLICLFTIYQQSLEYLMINEKTKNEIRFQFLYARCLWMHNQIIDDCSDILFTKIKTIYPKLIKVFQDLNQEDNKYQDKLNFYTSLKLEYALLILNFYKYQESKKDILEVMSLQGIEVNFTGKLGIKTKYQTFKVPQLVVEVKNQNQEEQNDDSNQFQPKVCKLDDIFDNILHEKPLLDDKQFFNKQINLQECLVILALIKNSIKSSPLENIHQQQLLAYLTRVNGQNINWAVSLNCLVIQAQLEFSITKKMERAMNQCEEIYKDWNRKDIPLGEKLKYCFFINFPNYFEIIENFANNYKQIGSLMSASALLEDCELYEQSMECKAMAGNQDQALLLLDKLSEERKNSPKMLCLLGDIHKDITYYKKALEVSNGKSMKALESIGYYYFVRKDYEKSKEYYEQAVEINQMNFRSWKNLGFINMMLKQYEQSLKAYKKAIFINSTSSEIWANMAGLNEQLGKLEEAFENINQALKLKERNWAMWYKLMMISFQLLKFKDFVKGALKIIELGQYQQLKPFIIEKFYIILEHEFESKCNKDNIRQLELLYRSTEKIFEILKKFKFQDSIIWIELRNVLELGVNIIRKKQQFVEEENFDQKNFVIKIDNFNQRVIEQKQQIFETFKKQAFTHMQIGWQQNKQQCEQVLKVHQESLKYLNENQKYFNDYEQKIKDIQQHIDIVKSFLKNLKK